MTLALTVDGVTHTFPGPVIKVGALDSSHLKLFDKSVSRMHAVIEIEESLLGGERKATVIDLGSMSGTWVNGGRINKSELRIGDKVSFGKVDAIVTEAPSDVTPAVVNGARHRRETQLNAAVRGLSESLNTLGWATQDARVPKPRTPRPRYKVISEGPLPGIEGPNPPIDPDRWQGPVHSMEKKLGPNEPEWYERLYWAAGFGACMLVCILVSLNRYEEVADEWVAWEFFAPPIVTEPEPEPEFKVGDKVQIGPEGARVFKTMPTVSPDEAEACWEHCHALDFHVESVTKFGCVCEDATGGKHVFK